MNMDDFCTFLILGFATFGTIFGAAFIFCLYVEWCAKIGAFNSTKTWEPGNYPSQIMLRWAKRIMLAPLKAVVFADVEIK